MKAQVLLPKVFNFPFTYNSKIKYKIGEEIITNIDIINEKQYLFFLRPELKNLSKNEMLEISKN